MGRFTGFDLSSNAYLESQWYMFSLVFLLAASYTLLEDKRVRVDVLIGRLTERDRTRQRSVGKNVLGDNSPLFITDSLNDKKWFAR